MRFLYVLTALALLFLTAGCSLPFKEDIQYYHLAERSSVDSMTSDSQHDMLHYPGIDIISMFSNDPTVKYAVHYPTINDHPSIEPIALFIEDLINNYVARGTELSRERTDHMVELNVTFDITYFSERYFSVIFNISQRLDAPLLEHQIRTFLIDLYTEEILTIVDLFQNGADYVGHLSGHVHQATLDEGRIEHFTVNDEGLTIYSEYNHVERSVFIPWTNLYTIIDETIQLNIEGENNLSQVEIPSSEPLQSEEVIEIKEDIMLHPTKKVALTFDDGPHQEVTPSILASLKKYNAKATFFMLGKRAEFYQDIVQQVSDEGHEIGNHTWDHPHLSNLSDDNITSQLDRTSELLQSITGEAPLLVRPPYGDYNNRVQQIVSAPLITWSIDTLDWRDRNADAIMLQLEAHMHDEAIILMHDTYPSTAEAVERMLAKYTEEGYMFVTVSELLEFDEISPVNGKIYRKKS